MTTNSISNWNWSLSIGDIGYFVGNPAEPGTTYTSLLDLSEAAKPSQYYYDSISMTSLTTITNVQEANSYGAYFLQQTAAACTALNGGSVAWATLQSEYATLSNSGKDYFVDADTTDANVVNARARYVVLFKNYGESKSWENFLVSSGNTPYYTPQPVINQHDTVFTDQESAYTLFMVIIALVLGSAGYVFMRKRVYR
jgi:hypothetical protein